MRRGICLLVSSSGMTYAVRVDEGNMQTSDLDIHLYESRGIQPDWTTLKTCPGMGPKVEAKVEKKLETEEPAETDK
jgi:hypothetical protein